MPEVRLNAADAADAAAAELSEMLQFLTGWLARDPRRLGAWAMTSASCAATWNALPSCSAAATASRLSAGDRLSGRG
jgi:hypothetical protein